MRSGPPKVAETVVALLAPPACREEVLGDLHERYRSPRQYSFDALRTIPLVIASRIRRTSDPQMLFMQALVLYLSFVGAARLAGGGFLHESLGLLRLAIPAGMALLALILDDVYARPGLQGSVKCLRGPVAGLGVGVLADGILWAVNPDLAVPPRVMSYGGAMSLLLTSAIRVAVKRYSGKGE